MKDAHIDEQYEWTQILARATRKTSKSVSRGLGLSRQSGAVEINEIHLLPIGTDPVNSRGPINPKAFVILGLLSHQRKNVVFEQGSAHVHRRGKTHGMSHSTSIKSRSRWNGRHAPMGLRVQRSFPQTGTMPVLHSSAAFREPRATLCEG